MAGIDALAMGRNTFETALTFGEWPYAGRRVVVFSRTLTRQALPAALADAVELFSGSVAELAGYLERSGARSVYVDGGQLIQGFLRAGLIGEITLTRIPVLLGSGIPLFGPVPQDIHLEHVRTRTYESGFVQSAYRVLGTRLLPPEDGRRVDDSGVRQVLLDLVREFGHGAGQFRQLRGARIVRQ